jgi:hypothetical protein
MPHFSSRFRLVRFRSLGSIAMDEFADCTSTVGVDKSSVILWVVCADGGMGVVAGAGVVNKDGTGTGRDRAGEVGEPSWRK